MKILLAPDKAILEAKKERNFVKSFIVLLISAFLITITIVIVSSFTGIPLQTLTDLNFPVILWTFLIVFLGGLFSSFVLAMVVNTLGGNGDYFDGLTTISYSLLPFSIGFLIMLTINTAPPLQTTDFNLMLTKNFLVFAIGIFFGAESFAIMYRAIKELFGVNMLISLVSVMVISLAFTIPLYVTLYSFMFGLVGGLLGGLLIP